ncbi:MAG: GNAT family N-acetyltransferase [Pseudomonadota bacterium]|nr:GNAT family N-acetyltransferase [Pseudomonadota bacterium]
MSLLTLAGPADAARLIPLITACYAEAGLTTTEDHVEQTLATLFDQDIQAAVWLIGPPRAPVGYLFVSFGFSLSRGGREALVQDIYIRPRIRARGMGTQALTQLVSMLGQMGVVAIDVPVGDDHPAAPLLSRLHFISKNQIFTRQT